MGTGGLLLQAPRPTILAVRKLILSTLQSLPEKENGVKNYLRRSQGINHTSNNRQCRLTKWEVETHVTAGKRTRDM